MRNGFDHVEEEDADENDGNECENGDHGNLQTVSHHHI